MRLVQNVGCSLALGWHMHNAVLQMHMLHTHMPHMHCHATNSHARHTNATHAHVARTCQTYTCHSCDSISGFGKQQLHLAELLQKG